MITVFHKTRTATSCWFVLLYFSSCIGQTNIDDCKANYKNTNNNLNAYYQSNDRTFLFKALNYAEKAMQCAETRRQSVENKISVLALLEDYKRGYEFVDSLKENDFTKSYKQKMHSTYFRALEYESKSDTASAYALYLKTISEIWEYIKSENETHEEELDQVAYYDLFFIKSKILSQEVINAELDSLAKQYPIGKDFFGMLKSSFTATSKEVSPMRQ